MKILVVGSDEVYAIENFYVRYLKEAGVDVALFPAQRIFYEYYQASLVNKLIYRAGFSNIIAKINSALKQNINNYQPTYIWIFKGMQVLPSTLRWISSKGIRLINYNPDNPFIFTGSGSGNSNITKSIALYDLHFTYNSEVLKKLSADYKSKTAYLPFGFDISDDVYNECSNEEEVNKLCFVGNPDKQRASFIQMLAEKGIEIHIYGNHWERFLNHDSVHIFPVVYNLDFWKALRRYRVQLNLMRIHNLNSHNMRSFEVPAIGGIMLAPDTAEHRAFFEDGKEVFLYNDIVQCVQQVKHIQGLTKQQADAVRLNARLRSIHSGYSYKDRTQQALSEIMKLV